ncbi:MAG: type II toxin-antitoxin system death-on-curing family toxin [Spirochaetae bacterium HGW-Spirochaetae-2]|jgi:death-on-curing protein|nr:MAG: type II toxin-antitoxin system death-on-curing family toxin [Spirochaetae bacterium HGW-Spirochaetae-2]
MIRFSLEQTLLVHSYLIEVSGGLEGLRDRAALESALSAPFQTFGGEDLYPGKVRKAAALCFGLIQNHPFIDGNKRIGVHLCDVFLELNGIKLEYTDEDLVQLGLSVADGSWGIPEILAWISRHQVL